MDAEIKTKDITIPNETVEAWQRIVDLLAEIVGVPAALIMRVSPPYIEVFRSSESADNPYKVGAKDHLPGLYCETVIKTKGGLLVPNALKDPHWDKNPDIKLGMISYLGYPILWPDGDVFGTICVVDLKENAYGRVYEDLLMQLKILAESHLAIILLAEELKLSKRDLERANAELESFVYSVSHDLRAPLQSINGFAHILLQDHSEKLDAQGKDCVNRIVNSAQHMAKLIDALLHLSRVSRCEIRRTRVALSAMAKKIAAEIQTAQPERRAEISIADGLTAEGDVTLLQDVLQNLLANAWKFTRGCSPARIEFGSTEVEGKQTYFVRDNGVGFDMAFEDRLFRVFHRLHSTKDYEGTGVGLATVRRIIERHGGSIWAKSEVGRGATIYFTLS